MRWAFEGCIHHTPGVTVELIADGNAICRRGLKTSVSYGIPLHMEVKMLTLPPRPAGQSQGQQG